MDTEYGTENFTPLKLVLVGGVSELSVGSEGFYNNRNLNFLDLKPFFNELKGWPRLEYHLHMCILGNLVIFYYTTG